MANHFNVLIRKLEATEIRQERILAETREQLAALRSLAMTVAAAEPVLVADPLAKRDLEASRKR